MHIALPLELRAFSNYNVIYSNNFIQYAGCVDAYIEGTGNVFTLAEPIGGNYWSGWTSPDGDGDGFVDYPYVMWSCGSFPPPQDNLPLSQPVTHVDSDGIADNVEGGAANGGDGNGDGIPDSQQENVASLPNAVDGRYATIASPQGTQLADVVAIQNPSPDDAPVGIGFPLGFFEFTLKGITPGGSTTVTLFLPQEVETFYKYGPTTDNPTSHWYEFLFDGTTGAEIQDKKVTLHFVDGERGDRDLMANGEIVEPGAAGIFPRTWLGFLSPLGPDNKRLLKQGSTIPVKFRIADSEGNPVTDAFTRLAIYYEEAGAPLGEPAVESTAAGDWGDEFRYDPVDDLYIFNLSTRDPSYLDWFTYQIVVTLDDGQTHEVDFSLK